MTRSTSDSNRPPRRTLSLKRNPDPPSTAALIERLHKVLAEAGLGSRRALEERIAQGQVMVNGEVAQLGSSVRSGDRIELDGRSFVASARSQRPARVLIYNKPEGEVCTREDPEGRPTVFDRLPQLKGARWINVGRLDINTTGLLLLTTDGELANALMHPSSEVAREYVCRIHGEVDEDTVQQLARGVMLEDGPAQFDEIERIGSSDSHAWFRVVLREGRNREVRRMWDALGFQVSRLKRVRYGSIALPRLLKRGHYQELEQEALTQLYSALKIDSGSASLSLQPVIGQRRAKATEYHPAPREQRAWTGSYHGDESRELRAFDHLREERPAASRWGKPARGGFKATGPGRKGKGRSPHPIPDDIGNRLTAPGGANAKPRRRKAAAPGFENPAEHRSWYVPEGVTTTSRIAPPRPAGRGSASAERSGNPWRTPGPQGERSARPPRGSGKPGLGRPGGKPGSGKPGSGKPGGGKPGGKARAPQGYGKSNPAHPAGPRGPARPGHGHRSNKPR